MNSTKLIQFLNDKFPFEPTPQQTEVIKQLSEFVVNSSSNKYTDANADITGISANNSISLDGNETIFKARTATVHSIAEFDSINSKVLSNDTQTSSASSSGFTSTNTNVDINVSDYVTTFQQAF